jgi:serine/threonine protein kinase
VTQESYQFGRYHLDHRIGAGAMSEVFRGRLIGALGFEKDVAIKLIHPHAAEDEETLKSLVNEAHIGSQLRHGNVIQTYEFDEIDGSYYLAMEFIDGWTLEHLIEFCRETKIHLPRSVIIEVMMAICSGLDYAHNLKDRSGQAINLVHRDLKPANIIIGRQAEIKILDFGVAKTDINPHQTAMQNVAKGTPAYMSPEQVKGDALDRRSDIYAIGSILYEVVTHNPPVLGSDPITVMQSILTPNQAQLRSVFYQIEPQLLGILDRCHMQTPAQRFQDAKTVEIELWKTAQATHATLPSLLQWLEDHRPFLDKEEARLF